MRHADSSMRWYAAATSATHAGGVSRTCICMRQHTRCLRLHACGMQIHACAGMRQHPARHTRAACLAPAFVCGSIPHLRPAYSSMHAGTRHLTHVYLTHACMRHADSSMRWYAAATSATHAGGVSRTCICMRQHTRCLRMHAACRCIHALVFGSNQRDTRGRRVHACMRHADSA
jgi:hypothetical protein